MVMARATKVTTLGQGGPLFEIAGNDGTEGLPGSVSDIDSQLIRWAALQSLLKRVPLISPVDFYHLASRFGLRRDPFTKKRAMHYGVDLAGWRGAPVYNTAPGKVVFAGRKGRYGKVVEIDHGYGLRTRYGHLRSVLVKRGQVLGHRHKIGLLGSTGRSTGPHVHYEVRFDGKPLNPDKFIKAGRYVFKG
ncbi:MAG: M23 family metallopeptidase, partial [Alphaproteobacteria bacterium]|nr:M23 family metallopeptidase [Alphaproteobacteria bacterium]